MAEAAGHKGRHKGIAIRSKGCISVVQELLNAIETAAEAGGQRLRRLDKKAERREVHNYVKALEEALEREQAPPAALSLAVPLLAAKVCSCGSLEFFASSATVSLHQGRPWNRSRRCLQRCPFAVLLVAVKVC